MAAPPRPRSLPIAPHAAPARRRLELAPEARDVDRRWRPIYCVWEITLRCDLACRHCGSRAGRARPDELTRAEALDVVDQMADLGVMEVTIIGGEAYLRDDWTAIAAHIVRRGMTCTMTTGGRGLDAARARAVKDAGITHVSVSVDGLRETHDMLRAVEGSHASALSAIASLQDVGVPVTANTQIGKANLGELDALFDLLADAGVRQWQVQLTAAMGRAADEPDLLLEPHQVLDVMAALARIKPRADARHIRIWPGNNIGYFGPYEELLRGRLPAPRSCAAGKATLGIEANGDVKGCPSLPTAPYVGGNLRDARLVDIWERSAELRFTRDRTAAELWGYCAGCYYADECRAGCSWTSHVLFGKRGNNPLCHHRAIELLREGKRERLVRRREAEGAPFDHALYEIVLEHWPDDELEAARALVPEACR
jgi:radical SAM protein with 4Fe4S-binding SPASM domain